MREIEKEVPIVLSFTTSYFIAAAASIFSILEHASEESRFHFICLLNESLKDEMEECLSSLVGAKDKISFLLIDEKELAGIAISTRYKAPAYYRLILTDLLPQYNKVMYIDCDVIVRTDLAVLFHNTALDEYYVAGVFEALVDFQVAHVKSIGSTPGKYINSGFLIMNLVKMRQDNMKEKFLEVLKNNSFRFPDQDTINQVCRGSILGLPPVYNSIRTYFIDAYKPFFLQYYSEKDWQDVQSRGTVHYTSNKPWNSYAIQFDIWWETYARLPIAIKEVGLVNKKILLLYYVYRTRIGRYLFDKVKYVAKIIRN